MILRKPGPFSIGPVQFYLLLGLPYCSPVGLRLDDPRRTAVRYPRIPDDAAGHRSSLFLGKFLCHAIWLQLLALVSGLLLLTVGMIRSIPGVAGFAPIFLAGQFLAVLSYGALSALLGLISQRFMVMGIIYGFVVEFGIGRIPTNINNLSLSRHLQTILANNRTIQELYDWVPDKSLFSVAAMLTASVLFLAAGAALFTFREYHHGEEMQK